MRVVLLVLGGLSLAVVMFVGGVVTAFAFFSAGGETRHLTSSADLWTNHPVRVDRSEEGLERVAGLVAEAKADTPPPPANTIDDTVTGSVAPDLTPSTEEPQLSEAHLDWCSSRYRSYRPRDNSYTPFSGGRRECVSPFTPPSSETVAATGTDAMSPPPSGEDSFVEEASDPAMAGATETAMAGEVTDYARSEHVQSCFARYRSYRVDDNTYQPFGGGPRRQCE
ncbi:BA14K family protein [Rhizobium sp. SSA_523]|uniref:BA14K family protein n=1 Tax=Rhizobium sp. SSA_523 TaxID=2952477 RepID=UPI0020905374|nr:BA14K family protein [Rhizobium sp. SSA_523]MCO5732498.1 BA14K family protein [Rhizobium sp. SSA_523]WKC22362.1 BA14K family protein [Rhizobium sp. SSA_523]